LGLVTYLEQLVDREGSGVDATLSLIQGLIRLGRTEEARGRAEKVPAEALEAREMLYLSALWLELDEPYAALPLALRAYRMASDDFEIARGFAIAVLNSKTAPAACDQVAADTHVVLRASDGSALEYVVFSEATTTRLNNEISLEAASQLGLVGLRVGDSFVQNPGAFFEKPFTVEKIQSALTYAFQDVIANYGKRFPTAPFFVTGFTLKTDPPTVADFQPLIDSAHDRVRNRDVGSMFIV